MSVIKYRADIDGLRALAILPVLFYHLGFTVFSGGFVGVDVFFVISGYLITSIIVREMQSGQFSMAAFWWRRARRILPAMTVMVVATLVAGWFLLAPHDYEELGRSVRYQAVFAANIFFLRQSGYFAPEAELQPLLHMWSLAIEEQFYIVYPPLLLLIWRLAGRRWLMVLLPVFVASLVFSAWHVYRQPAETFFLLHTRAWELLLGGLLVFLPVTAACPPRLASWASLAGFAAIVASVLLYDDSLFFPGITALLPAGGAALMIWAGERCWPNRLLAARPLVWIGILSYSLYLWHWPLIVFSRYWLADEYGLPHQCLLVVASFVIAWLSLKLVETPFRNRRLLAGRHQVLWLASGVILSLLAAGELIKKQQGFPARLTEQQRVFLDYPRESPQQRQCSYLSAETVNADGLCRLPGTTAGADSPAWLLWGDSHAAALLPLMDHLASRADISIWHGEHAACPPLLDVDWPYVPGCRAFNDAMLEAVRRHRIAHVVLASRWSVYLLGKENGSMKDVLPAASAEHRQQLFSRHLARTVDKLNEAGATVWLLEQAPAQAVNVPRQLTLLRMLDRDLDAGRDYASHQARQAPLSAIFAAVAQQGRLQRIDPAQRLCETGRRCRIVQDEAPLYVDDNHLSIAGVMLLEPLFQPLLDAAVKER